MSWFKSNPEGYDKIGFLGLLKVLLYVWLLPAVMAAVALGLQKLLNTPAMGDRGLMVWAGSILVLLSPALSWLGLVLAAPIAVMAMDRGWFGWIPAALIGMISGGVVAYLMREPLAIFYGAVMVVALRFGLGWRYPAAFRLP